MMTCLLLLAGLLATAAARSPTAPPPYPGRPGCTPGKSSFDGCNTCTCLPSRVISCTKRYCPPPAASCQHGRNFIDECQNACICTSQGLYACKRRGTPGGGVCYGGGRTGEPMKCQVDGEIRVEAHTRLFCRGGIVRFENTDEPDRCTPGSSWKEECNTCTCLQNGLHSACTRKACIPADDRPVLGGGGSGQRDPDTAGRRYCDGPCPADCGEVLDESRQCLRCQCGPQLNFGDVVVAIDSPCPAGLQEGPHQFATKTCLGQGCHPGATWKVNRDCSTCVCTNDREPACTPCQREPTRLTVTCEGGRPECPADCGRSYNAENDCYECPCGVGEEGDISVPFDQPCPPGYGHRSNGAFFKACGPLDTLPKGDTKLCDTLQCPADCGTVRISTEENCAYCQCGPELAPGDQEVPIDQECLVPRFPGPTLLATKVCKAPTRQKCAPHTQFNIECDVCLCQDDGVPACTKRDCSLPEYGTVQVCGTTFRSCPADCGVAGVDSFCLFCQCGPRLNEGDIVIGMGDECPAGFTVSARQWATKTCSPVPQCQYGPAYIDECTNVCSCAGDVYGCTRKACRPGQTTTKPLSCDGTTELPRVPSMRVFCHEGIVKIQALDKPCVPNSWSMDAENCNTCRCLSNGAEACTLMACEQRPLECQYGPAYIDECTNVCHCAGNVYGCTRKACRRSQTASKPLSCDGTTKLPREPGMRVFCHEGIVKIQTLDKPCVPNSWSMDAENCNKCSCFSNGAEACTLKACVQLPAGGY